MNPKRDTIRRTLGGEQAHTPRDAQRRPETDRGMLPTKCRWCNFTVTQEDVVSGAKGVTASADRTLIDRDYADEVLLHHVIKTHRKKLPLGFGQREKAWMIHEQYHEKPEEKRNMEGHRDEGNQ